MTALPPPPPPGAPALPDHLRRTRRSRVPFVVGGGVVLVALLAFLAFGVFGVQALWIDDEVAEAAPTFSSGATVPTGDATTPTTAPASTAGDDGASDTPTTAAAPVVTVAATGT